MRTSPLADRVALVTGASSGVGRAITVALAATGARIVAVGRDRGRLDETIARAEPAAARLEAVACDLTDDDAVGALVERSTARRGVLDVLVHCAGSIEFGMVEDVPADRLDALVRTNVRAPYVLTRAALPLLRASRGHVVFVNSSAAVRPTAGVAAYGMTKHALRGFANALRDEVNPAGIRVTTVFAGRTRTPMQESVYRWEGRGELRDGLIEPDDIAAIVVALLDLPRERGGHGPPHPTVEPARGPVGAPSMPADEGGARCDGRPDRGAHLKGAGPGWSSHRRRIGAAVTVASVLLPLIVLLLIWTPELTRFATPRLRATEATVEAARRSPDGAVLEELRRFDLLPIDRRDEAMEVSIAEGILEGRLELPTLPDARVSVPFSPDDFDRLPEVVQLWYAGFVVPDMLLAAYVATDREEFFTTARDFIAAWNQYEQADDEGPGPALERPRDRRPRPRARGVLADRADAPGLPTGRRQGRPGAGCPIRVPAVEPAAVRVLIQPRPDAGSRPPPPRPGLPRAAGSLGVSPGRHGSPEPIN